MISKNTFYILLAIVYMYSIAKFVDGDFKWLYEVAGVFVIGVAAGRIYRALKKD